MIQQMSAQLHRVKLWTPEGQEGVPIWMLEAVAKDLGFSVGPGATGTSLSDFLENKLLDHVLGGPDYTRAATVYPALYTAAPSDAGGGTEVTGGSYARPAITNNATNFPAAAAGAKSNGTVFSFVTATADWGTVTHVGLLDAVTAGNLLWWGALTTSKVIGNGDTGEFAIGELDFLLD